MGKFDADRFKAQLKLTKCRLDNLLKQHQNSRVGRRREIANLLQTGHEDRARVKYLIRDDYLMEAYEMLLTYCEDLIQSTGLIAGEKYLSFSLQVFQMFLSRTLNPDLILPAKSLLYACGRIDVPELNRLKEQFESKFGKEFGEVNSEVGKTSVNPSLIVKLSIRSPDLKLINRYLTAIAQIFNVLWQAPPEEPLLDEPIDKSASPSIPASASSSNSEHSGPPPPYSSDLGHAPPGTEGSNRQFVSGSPTLSSMLPPPSNNNNDGIPNFEELTRRFQALKVDKRSNPE